jgi:spermidine synthase
MRCMRREGNSGSNYVQQPVATEAMTVQDRMSGLLLWAVLGLSGFACLVYQILWMRQLGLLFGNRSQAAALTLAVFFAGLAVGGWWWGARSRQISKPMRAYAWLEWGISACGLLLIVAPAVVSRWYPLVYQRHGSGAGMVAFTLVCTWLLVFPPALLMGGTLPMVGQAVIRGKSTLGRMGATLYAVNTLGAACGAFAAAFLLIRTCGVGNTCGVAMAASFLAGVLAFVLSRKNEVRNLEEGGAVTPVEGGRGKDEGMPLSRRVIRGLAFFSGFQLLALEVIWTRMMAQVHENSVYAFSSILIVVLVCLALGSVLAGRFARGRWPVSQAMVMLLALGGASLCFLPRVFLWHTSDFTMLATDHSLSTYVFRLFGTCFLTIGPCCLVLGAVFPLLMKAEERYSNTPGWSIGQLSAINTLGAIAGSLVAGFFLLENFGLWGSMQCVAASYLLAAILIPSSSHLICVAWKGFGALMLLLAYTLLHPKALPSTVTFDSDGKKETILDVWEGSDCTVSVVKDSRDDIAIKINANYSLGSTGAYVWQMHQARLPLLAFPETDRVFFLGMGTGITAGEALDRESFPRISEVTACELSPNVVKASRKYFAGGANQKDFTNGLYSDPRAKVLTADGRNHLMGTDQTYAMINADLFLPYRRGTGNLYSLEHFQAVKNRLKPGGVFVQWLPLYQLSEREFGIIAKTMLAVFPQVSLWRGNFQPGSEMAALVGHSDLTPLPACELDAEPSKREAVEGASHMDLFQLMLPTNEQTILFFYAGNLSGAKNHFDQYAINTDDRPVMEFGTPLSLHRRADEAKPQFLEKRFGDLVDMLLQRTPTEKDPLLVLRTEESRKLPYAGAAYHRASIAMVRGDETSLLTNWQTFLEQWSSAPSPFDP